MKMIWEKIALFFIVLFAILGALFLSIIVHEYSHYNDFKFLNVTDERLCGFVLPTGPHIQNWSNYIWSPAGYYGFSVETDNMTASDLAKYQEVKYNTELRAFSIGASVFVFFLLCYMIIIFGRYNDKLKILIYQFQVQDNEDYIHQLENYINDIQQS